MQRMLLRAAAAKNVRSVHSQGIFAVILWLVTAVLAVVLVWQIVLLIKAVLTTLAITAIVALVPFVWRGIGRLFEWVSNGRFCYAA